MQGVAGLWLINLEELPSCVPMVQAALYQLALERKVGEYELPEGASLIACGTLRRIVDMHPMSRIDDLMHWNFIPTILGVTPGQTHLAVSRPEPERRASSSSTPIDTPWATQSSASQRTPDTAQMRLRPARR